MPMCATKLAPKLAGRYVDDERGLGNRPGDLNRADEHRCSHPLPLRELNLDVGARSVSDRWLEQQARERRLGAAVLTEQGGESTSDHEIVVQPRLSIALGDRQQQVGDHHRPGTKRDRDGARRGAHDRQLGRLHRESARAADLLQRRPTIILCARSSTHPSPKNSLARVSVGQESEEVRAQLGVGETLELVPSAR